MPPRARKLAFERETLSRKVRAFEPFVPELSGAPTIVFHSDQQMFPGFIVLARAQERMGIGTGDLRLMGERSPAHPEKWESFVRAAHSNVQKVAEVVGVPRTMGDKGESCPVGLLSQFEVPHEQAGQSESGKSSIVISVFRQDLPGEARGPKRLLAHNELRQLAFGVVEVRRIGTRLMHQSFHHGDKIAYREPL